MYFITAVDKNDVRCIGYYSNKETAIESVKRNSGDMNEAGAYPYVVIENIPEGIYNYDTDPLWFTYNDKTDTYEESDAPLFVKSNHGLVGFAIG